MAYLVPPWVSNGIAMLLDVLLPSPGVTCGRTGSPICAGCLEASSNVSGGPEGVRCGVAVGTGHTRGFL